MALDDAAWAEIAQLYRDSDLTVREITDRYGITFQMLYSRREREGWPKRSAAGHRSCATTDTPGESSALLVRRLFRAIDLKLQRLERRMTSGDEPTIADSERETRELANMIRSFEKVTGVAADIAKPAAGAAKSSSGSQSSNKSGAKSKCTPPAGAGGERTGYVSADAERMRREIAERLEKLHLARTAGG